MLTLTSTLFAAMGSHCHLHLYSSAPSEAEAVADAAIGEVRRIEAQYSRYRPDSLLSHINRTAENGGVIAVDEETAALLNYACGCYRKSGGLFDITAGILRRAWDFSTATVPEQAAIARLLPLIGLDKLVWQAPQLRFPVPGMELDFGGIGKEYAADRAAAVCRSLGVVHGLVDLGGDIAVIGPHPDRQPWLIGIAAPDNPKMPATQVALSQGGLATSGDYRRFIDIDGTRYSHLLNPHSGWPVQGLSSVSVVADQCLVAGSLATIAMLKGASGIDWLNALDASHFWQDSQGQQGGSLAVSRPC